MIYTIMTASGIPYRQGRYPNPPAETYGIIFDDQTVEGAYQIPGAPKVVRHDGTIELYEPKPDPEAEARLEKELDNAELDWIRQDRYWLQNVQRYQVIYEFTYYTKRRN